MPKYRFALESLIKDINQRSNMNQNQVRAWAVEADGKLDVANVLPTRQVARVLRKSLVQNGLAKKASVRKVSIILEKGKV